MQSSQKVRARNLQKLQTGIDQVVRFEGPADRYGPLLCERRVDLQDVVETDAVPNREDDLVADDVAGSEAL
jgi:hypothetical protein